MNLQYCHNRNYYIEYGSQYHFGDFNPKLDPRGGATIVLEAFTVAEFEALKPMDSIKKKVGVARCSKLDNYNKKIGRQIATARAAETELVVKAKENDHLLLNDAEGNEYILRKLSQYTRVHFVEFYGE